MSEEYTIDSYLGAQFQLKLLWQLLTEPEFSEQIFPFIKTEYWDDANYKRYYIVLNEYYKEFGKIPNLQNKSIYNAIARFKISSDSTDEEILLSLTEKLKNWNERVLNKEIDYDGEIIQKQAFTFIKQGEYADLANFILTKVKKGQLKDETLYNIEDKLKKIADIGSEEDDGSEVFEDIDAALQKTFRNPIPTGIAVLDQLMGGGLGRGEMGIVLAPSGVGKSTILSIFANEAKKCGKNVLQIIFEDTPDQIKRKHYAIWSGIELSEMDDRRDEVAEKVIAAQQKFNDGKLIIKRFSQEDTTIPKIRKWIDRYRKKIGIKFDMVVLDYLDCVETHKKAVDQNQAELAVVKAFEAMAGELDIPCWTALQTNRSGFGLEKVGHQQMGGNIKRAQKTHFLMSVSKTDDQKEGGLANITILKARFAKDGQFFEDAIFDNGKVRVRINDSGARKVNIPDADPEKLNEKVKNVTDKKIQKKKTFDDQPNEDEKANALQDMLNKFAEKQDIKKKE